MSRQPKKFSFKELFNPITLIIGFIFLIGLILMSLAVFLLGRDPTTATGATPVVTKIAAFTPTIMTNFPTQTVTPTPTSIFFLPEGVIDIGAYVQVIGTGGAGLRMRAEPGLDSAIRFSALDAEVFLVIDGPIISDGYTWWHLEAPYDQSRNGWSAGDFLTPIQEENE